MKLFKLTLLCLIAVIVTACGDNDKFKIHGTVAENRTLNLRIVYFGNDNINNVLTAARDGVFEFEGNAKQDAIVEILDNDYRLLARLYAHNGEEYTVALNPASPRLYTVKGSAVNEAWTKWNADNINTLNMRNSKLINEAVERYVKTHKNDILSTLLILTEYDASPDPVKAQKLLQSVAPDARPAYLVESWVANVSAAGESKVKTKVLPITYIAGNDSLGTFNPKKHDYSLLVFSTSEDGRSDSIVPKLRELSRQYSRRRLAVVDFSLDNDTFVWRRNVREDSITWTAAWGAGSVAAPGIEQLSITTLPFFIVADSAGNQIYRGPSITAANATLATRLR
jgi:hypothetical protein